MFDITDFSLGYELGALAPYISEETMNFHYGKHLAGYIANLNKLISGTELEHLGVEEIMQRVAGKPEKTAIFNNAGQVYNHHFFFSGMKRDAIDPVPAEVVATFGSVELFMEQFKMQAMSVFGSGWVWLCLDTDGALKLEKTANADNPLVHGKTPILTLDVWEHAYYLDYQNRRAEFVDNFLAHLVNWRVVGERIKNATKE